MATIKFLIQTNKPSANIYLRLSINRDNVFKRKTGYVIDPVNWSAKRGQPKANDDSLKNLKTDLDKLRTQIEQKLNQATTQGVEIDGNWLQITIYDILNTKQKSDVGRLTNYFQHYIDNLPNRVDSKGRRGVTQSTLTKYKTILLKVQNFEAYQKKHYYAKDVDLKFREDIIHYFSEIEKLSTNTTGRYIKFIKTVCLDARRNGIETHQQLDQIKGFTEKVPKVYLCFDELENLLNTDFKRNALNNARDWLVIGCYVGQRVSDLLVLTKENIHKRGDLELIELTQKKTGKHVAIPLYSVTKQVLEKRAGNFPYKISKQKFNEYLKEIGKIGGLTRVVEGSRFDKKTKRKITGRFELHELITSHICRRSFATNFYGKYPTSLLIGITAHSTEQQFLEYIGKNSIDFAVQLAKYWHAEVMKEQEKQTN